MKTLLLLLIGGLLMAPLGAHAQVRPGPAMATNPAAEAAEIARLQTRIAEQQKTITRLKSDYADYQGRLKICKAATTRQVCIDNNTARSLNGRPVSCGAYTCNQATGFCQTTCRSSNDCVSSSCVSGVCR